MKSTASTLYESSGLLPLQAICGSLNLAKKKTDDEGPPPLHVIQQISKDQIKITYLTLTSSCSDSEGDIAYPLSLLFCNVIY